MVRSSSFWFRWWFLVAVDLCLALGWILAAARLNIVDGDTGWLLLWLFPATAVILTLTAAAYLGWRPTSYATIAAITIIALIFQIHAGFRLAYLDGDVAIDTMIYNTTSPDVPRITRELSALSQATLHDPSLAIQVEACESIDWVMRWYLRDMPNVSYLREIPADPALRAPVIIGSLPEWSGGSCSMPKIIPGYTSQQIALRWHEPEWAVYRYFAIAPELDPGWSAWRDPDVPHGITAVIGSVIDSLGYAFTPAGQHKLFDLLMYRQSNTPLNPFFVNVYIRNDLVPAFNDIRYGQ